jgi:hypothetical protein
MLRRGGAIEIVAFLLNFIVYKRYIKHHIAYATKAYGSGCIDPHFLDLSTSWR